MHRLLLVGLGLLLRVGWVLLIPTKPVGDFAMYRESASYLLAQGALDPEFVYMPGYVMMLAAVEALGGGLLAQKLMGALLGGLATGAVYGIAAALWDRRAATAAALAYAVWPAGIAVCSVTGTDLPSAVFVLTAVWLLVRVGGERPLLGAILFGAAMGLGAYLRAVAVPLAVFSIVFFRARGLPWRRAGGLAALSAGLALLVLSPWVVRNHARYGEWFLTDSHGGLTALVGANPDTDGRYSRSLNRMFKEVTGYELLREPHREADRASYRLARDLTAFSPAYAAGLVALKAERLLDHERALLYWPLYRAGVLPDGRLRTWLEANRADLEALVDGFWVALCVTFAAGLGLGVARRRWIVFALLPVQLALCGIYALYFAEVRYQLPIVMLMFPVAGGFLGWVADELAHLARRERPDLAVGREAAITATAIVLLLVGWPSLLWAGQRLRERHRFAAHLCRVGGVTVLCKWRPEGPDSSPVRGVFDGVGLALDRWRSRATLVLALPPGSYRLRAVIDAAPVPGPEVASPSGGRITLSRTGGHGDALTQLDLGTVLAAARRKETVPIDALLPHAGGVLEVELATEPDRPAKPPFSLWLSGLALEREGGLR